MTASLRPPFGRPVPGNRWDLVADHMPSEPPSVSVVVPYYRQQAELDRTLTALRRQTHPADRLEIIVVDDGSPEAPAVPDGVRLLRQEDDGFRAAAARNLGARHATGRILVFLDADTTPEPDYIASLTRLPSLLPEAVTVGRRRHADLAGEPIDDPIEDLGPRVELAEPAWLAEEYRRSGDLLHADQRSYRFVISAVLCCSAWLFERIGGFDETFRTYGGEDWEWAHRAWVDGAVLAHVPGAVAWHDGPDWAGRDDAGDRAKKNAETLALAEKVAVSGSRPPGLIGGSPDVVCEVAAAVSRATAFVTADSLLSALPQAAVVLPAEHGRALATTDPRISAAADDRASAALGRARVVISVEHPVRIDDAHELRAAVEAVGNDDLGAVRFTAPDGAVVLVTSRRARVRAERWGESCFLTEDRDASWLRFAGEEPNVAAYLGGWG